MRDFLAALVLIPALIPAFLLTGQPVSHAGGESGAWDGRNRSISSLAYANADDGGVLRKTRAHA